MNWLVPHKNNDITNRVYKLYKNPLKIIIFVKRVHDYIFFSDSIKIVLKVC